MRAKTCLAVVLALFAVFPRPAMAGMPTITLSDFARMRLSTISFFLVVICLCALVVLRCWNSFCAGFPKLPRMTYPKALAAVVLWGLLFIVVLTMISGARELMTPGAWVKQGFTYSLASAQPTNPEKSPDSAAVPSEEVRTSQLLRLYGALAQFAHAHDAKYPDNVVPNEIPDECWVVPERFGMRYGYVRGRTTTDGEALLAYEPDVFGDVRFVLTCDGQVRPSNSGAIAMALAPERKP
jgi:hypothetical protein